MVAVCLQASRSCTTALAAKLEKTMLKVVQRQKDDNGSGGIPEIHCTTALGTQLRCRNSICRLGSLHCRSLVTQLPLHAGIQAKLSPVSALGIVLQTQADRRTRIA